MELQTGDLVMLKSGGPDMTVKGFIRDLYPSMIQTWLKASGYQPEDVECVWFENNKMQSGYFRNDMLKKKEQL